MNWRIFNSFAALPAVALAAALSACASPTATSGSGSDASALSDATAGDSAVADTYKRTQYYAAKLVFHGGTYDGRVQEWDRDLTKIDNVLIYGNTHLTPPAVAFGLQDHMQVPVTTKDGTAAIMPLDFQLRFGILVEAVGFPVNTGKAGTYPFACTSPLVQVNLNTWTYRSTCPASSGQFEIDKWSASPGGHFSGTVKGKVPQFIFDSSHVDDCKAENTALTCSKPNNWVDVEAEFDFVVPELNKNSAPDAWP